MITITACGTKKPFYLKNGIDSVEFKRRADLLEADINLYTLYTVNKKNGKVGIHSRLDTDQWSDGVIGESSRDVPVEISMMVLNMVSKYLAPFLSRNGTGVAQVYFQFEIEGRDKNKPSVFNIDTVLVDMDKGSVFFNSRTTCTGSRCNREHTITLYPSVRCCRGC